MPDTYTFTGVDHITVTVSDMERSLRFYRDLLGFKVTIDAIAPHDRDIMNLSHRTPRESHRMVTFDTGGGPTVSLTEYKDPKGKGLLLDDLGITHYAIGVSDLEALTKWLRSTGYPKPKTRFFLRSGWNPHPIYGTGPCGKGARAVPAQLELNGFWWGRAGNGRLFP